MKKKREKTINCFVYLSTEGDINGAEVREIKQLRYIREYAKAHNIIIKKVFHGMFWDNMMLIYIL